MPHKQIILNYLASYLDANPTIRFGQALVNLNIIRPNKEDTPLEGFRDPFYDEDKDICERLKVIK